eukprot:1517588-Rhodomonas_salina.3
MCDSGTCGPETRWHAVCWYGGRGYALCEAERELWALLPLLSCLTHLPSSPPLPSLFSPVSFVLPPLLPSAAPPPAPPGSVFDETTLNCFFCPRGTFQVSNAYNPIKKPPSPSLSRVSLTPNSSVDSRQLSYLARPSYLANAEAAT